ncbi:hypothetical protein IFM89_014340 [Coptis chinensis]|uniref:Transposase-associated domain-containing protein n=1 Tax=Coptis chinensis TaxID=261450 RepID=A0A835LUB9_9MAGN|nr:hypothetical protein IFM89_014340 [Coptis chinensis]
MKQPNSRTLSVLTERKHEEKSGALYFDYLFYIDFEASMAEPRAQNALGHLQLADLIRSLTRDVAIKVIDLEEAMSRQFEKEWMNELDGLGDVYKQGVADFIQFAIAEQPLLDHGPCPCRECRNGKSFVFDTISRHLISQPRPSASQPSSVLASHASRPSTSVSHPSQPSATCKNQKNVRKLPILIDIDGVVVGDNASGWNTFVFGSLIRAQIPA